MSSGLELVPVPIAPGMREDIDPRMLPLGVPRLLQNVRARQQGRLEKRAGTLALGTSGMTSTASALWVGEYGGRAVTGTEIVESEPVLQKTVNCAQVIDPTGRWHRIGTYGSVVPERRFGLTQTVTKSFKQMTSVAVGDLLYTAAVDGVTGTDIFLFCTTLEGVLLKTQRLTEAAAPRLLYVNSVLYLVYWHTTGTDILVSVVSQSTLTPGTPVTVNATGGAQFDVAPIEGSNLWIFACAEAATTLRVRRMTATTSTTADTFATTTDLSLIGVAALSGGKVVVGFQDGNNIETWIMDEATLTNEVNTVVDTETGSENWREQVGVVRTSASDFAITYGGSDSTSAPALDTYHFYHARIDTTGVVTSGPTKVWHYSLASKPFTFGPAGSRQVMVWAHNLNDLSGGNWREQAAHYLLALVERTSGGAMPVAHSNEHLATYGSSVNFRAYLPEVATFSDGRFAAPLNWNDPGALSGIDVAVFRSALRSESIRWSHRFSTTANRGLLISGGCLYEHCDVLYDAANGAGIEENGFFYDPEIVGAVSTGSGLTADREYTYVAVYRWNDAGRVHRSAPSEAIELTPTGTDLQATIRVSTLEGSNRYYTGTDSPVAEIYRSWNGGPYYYVGITAVVTGVAAASVTFVDSSSDATAEANPTLYTDAGIIPNEPPSGARLICEGGNRVFCVGWRENVVQVSKIILPTTPAEFCDHDNFRIFVPEPITGIAWLDGALVIFSARNIYVVGGDGPSDQGAGGYSDPRRLPAPVGCDDARSLLEVPQGLFFYGGGSLWLLPRGFGPPQPVGAAIQETLDTYPYVAGAALCEESGNLYAHFLLHSTDVSSSTLSRIAVFDVTTGGWTIDSLSATTGAIASVVGTFTFTLVDWDALADFPIRQLSVAEDQDYSANGAERWIESRVGFGDWRPGGPLGRTQIQRIQLMGEVLGRCKVKMDVTLNGTAETARTKTYTAAATTAYLETQPTSAPCNAIRLDVYDAQDDLLSYSRGFALNAMAFEHLPTPGLRLSADPATERF
jgi:hypothetical protein